MKQFDFFSLLIGLSLSLCARAQFYGPDEFIISDAGGFGNTAAFVNEPDAAYRTVNNTFLVVWESDDTDQPGISDGEDEIIGRFIDLNGNAIAPDFLISNNGNDPDLDNEHPRVAYSTVSDVFLIVWEGELINGEEEIFGAVISGNGSVVASNFRISTVGTDGVTARDAADPSVAYDPLTDQFLVVYEGDDITDGEDQILGQFVDDLGALVGNQFSIARPGDGSNGFDAEKAAVAYNSVTNNFAVAYQGDINSGESEAFIISVSGTGTVGTPIRVSERVAADSSYDTFDPELAYDPIAERFLVVFRADNTASGEEEIFGRIMDNNLSPVTNEFDLSQVGAPGDTGIDAFNPDVTYDPAENDFKVVFRADALTGGDDEIFMRRVDAAGTVNSTLFQVSDTQSGGSGDAFAPRIVSNDVAALLTIYRADNHGAGFTTIDGEFEVYGQFYGSAALSSDSALANVEMNIFPNPASSYSNISGLGDGKKTIRLFNSVGQVLQVFGTDSDEHRLDLSSLSSGMYLVQIAQGEFTLSRKLIKQ